MIEATLLVPASKEAAPADPKDLFLWQAETKPLGDPPEPTEAQIQEIVVDPQGTGALSLIFNADDPDLSERVAGACHSLYALHGSEGLRDFRNALQGTGVQAAGAFMEPLSPVRVRGELIYLGEEETPKRHALIRAFEKHKEVLETFVGAAVARIEAVAAQVAQERLRKVKDQLFKEAMRYLALKGDGSASGANGFLDGSERTEGPEVMDLAEAMWEIATLRRELALARGAQDRARRKARTARQHYWPNRRELEAALAAASRERSRSEEALARICAEHCATFPVLYRLWDQPVTLEVGAVWADALPNSRAGALQHGTSLAKALAETINAVASEATEFEAELRAAPEEAWRYDPAVFAALDALYLAQGDLGWKAAEEKLESVNGSLSPLSKLSMGLGGVELLASALAVPPPAAAVIAVASLAAGIAELVESALVEARKDRAFRACLNPGDSLAMAPGAYGAVAIGALFLMLQIKDVNKGLGKLGGVW